MSELQIGLLAVGIIVIAGVYGLGELNIWRERKKIRQSFAHDHTDVLLNVPKNHVRDTQSVERLEPSFLDKPTDDLADESLAQQAPAVFQHHEAESYAKSADSVEVDEPNFSIDIAELALIDLAWLDNRLDFIADVLLAAPLQLKAAPQFTSRRRITLVGCNSKGIWQLAETKAETKYIAFRIGLQCVDRSGAISDEELTAFYRQAVNFAQEVGAEISLPPRKLQLEAARKLDAFCSEVDVLVGIHISFANPVIGEYLANSLNSSGFTLEPDGVFHYLDEEGDSLCTISPADQAQFDVECFTQQKIKSLVLLFDIPRVKGGEKTFDEVIELVKAFTEEFNGKLIDDNQRVLTENGLQHIRQQIQQMYQHMHEYGVEPGEALAQRLFS